MFRSGRGLPHVARALLGIGLALAPPAGAFDGAGDPVVPQAGDPRDPLTVWSAFATDAGLPGGGIVAEYARDPLVREVDDGSDVTIEPVLRDLVGAHVLVHAPVHRRFAIGARMPVWLWVGGEAPGGPAPGDLRVWAPVRVVDPGDDGVAFSVVPALRLPTGADARHLGASGVGGGVDLALGWRAGPFVLNTQAGIDSGAPDESGAPGGPRLAAGASVGWAIAPIVAAHLEARAGAALGGDGGVGAEALLGVRGRPLPWLGFVAGVGHGLSDGAGAATWRAYAGVVLPAGLRAPTGSASEVRVVDPSGRPVRGARVSSGTRALGATDPDGALAVPRVRRAILVEADGFEPGVLDTGALGRGGAPAVVMLHRRPVDVRVRVHAPDPQAVTVTLSGPTDPGAPRIADETWAWAVPPGEWRATVEAPGMAPQTWLVAIDDTRTEPVHIDASMTVAASPGGTVVVRVRDPLGGPVEGALVRVGRNAVGTTGPGGEVSIGGVAAGSQAVTIETGTHAAPAPGTVRVGAAAATAEVMVGWLPGSVRVEAVGPDGAVTDALVRLDGPEVRPAFALGPDGVELVRLRPGRWTALVSSPTLGAQERAFDVTDDPGRVRVVRVELIPYEPGASDLALALYDPDGAPIEGARVFLDDRPVGLTSSLGSMTLLDLVPGPRRVRVEAPWMRALERRLVLVDGLYVVEEVLAWESGTVRVRASAPDGAPIDAMVAFGGPHPVPATGLGPDGVGLFTLAAGAWEVGVSSPEWGLQARPVTIPEASSELVRVDVLMQPPGGDGRLSVTVTDPEGAPLADVEVLLDGRSLGFTANGGKLVASSLATGPRRIALRAPGYAGVDEPIRIRPVTEAAWQLPWGPGALRVVVTGPGGPVDAMLAVAGPRALPPMRVGADGTRVLALDPGTWSVLASSPELGAQEREVVLSPRATLTTVEFALAPVPDGRSVLLLRVRDPDGGPIEGVEVRRRRERLGTTSASGSWLSPAWPPGAVALDLDPPVSWRAGRFDGDVPEGSHQRVAVLPWRTSSVAVRVADPQGEPVAARVWFVGPSVVAERDVGPGEIVDFDLRPGAWTAYADASGFGAAWSNVLVDPGDGPRRVDITLRGASTTVTAGSIDLSSPIPFDLDRTELRPDARVLVAEVARLLRENPGIRRLEVGGHTDDSGGEAYNQQLSERRAESVRQGLIELGVEPERLIARGYGLSRPLTPNVDDTSRAVNRRVEFRIATREEGP